MSNAHVEGSPTNRTTFIVRLDLRVIACGHQTVKHALSVGGRRQPAIATRFDIEMQRAAAACPSGAEALRRATLPMCRSQQPATPHSQPGEGDARRRA